MDIVPQTQRRGVIAAVRQRDSPAELTVQAWLPGAFSR